MQVKVISWYSSFIDIKLKRALLPDDLEDEFQRYDMLGSAKVAKIAIERSIAAHAILLRHLPDEEDSLLRLLSMLEKVRRGCYELLSGAMEFVRPGLDERQRAFLNILSLSLLRKVKKYDYATKPPIH